MTDGHDVRVEMERAVAGLDPVDLLDGVHQRAGRLRRRRRVAGGVAAAVSAAAVVAAGATVPALVSRNDPAAVVAVRPETPAPTPPPPAGPRPTATAPPEGTRPAAPPVTPPTGTHSPAASSWGATTLDDDFTGSAPGRAWKVYEGAGDDLGRWSPGNVAVSGGALRLTVSRPGGDPPSRWGGIGAAGSAQRYGRWETRIRMGTGRGLLGQFVLSPPVGSGPPALVVSVAPYAGRISVSGTGTGGGGSRTATLRQPTDYHTVAVEWTPERVRVLLDGQRLFEWTDGRLPAPLWPALQTIMAGPDCGAVPVSADCQGTTVAFPQRFDVDRLTVRAYRD
jgi:licheninase